MEKLPTELLFKILLYLPPVDRLYCSETCRRLAEAMTSSQLLDDIRLTIPGYALDEAIPVFANSKRQYTRLRLCKADLSKYDSEFWEKVGANLRELYLERCLWSNDVLYSILRQCTKAESLKLVNYGWKSAHTFSLPEGVSYEELRNSLSHFRHLYLQLYLTAENLDFLLGLMSNVTSVFVRSNFDYQPDYLERLPRTLKKNQISSTAVDFYKLSVKGEKLLKFVEATSDSLEELQIDTDALTERVCQAIVNCTRLRRLILDIFSSPSFNAAHLRKLVSNSPNVEILKNLNIRDLGDEGMAVLPEFKKLHTLRLIGPAGFRLSSKSLCRLKEISTLVELNLTSLRVDSRALRSLGRLTSLQTLILEECVDSECLEVISENLDRLTELDLGKTRNLTEAGALNICRFRELRSLKFSWGNGFTDVVFKRGFGSRTMKSLFISGCPITDDGLLSIASHHGRLETFGIYDCDRITDVGFIGLLQSLPRLKELFVSPCSSMQYEWCTTLRDLCPRLRDWYVYNRYETRAFGIRDDIGTICLSYNFNDGD